MSKAEKIFKKVMSGQSDANIGFADLCSMLEKLGYTRRNAKGSHRLYARGADFLNVQPEGNGKAKKYQVRQVREQLQDSNLRP